ncbi:MAG TPA: hypothetical protein VFU74_16185 [Actinocrinis sp.]|nr:hypothetical protein [Actinocrinis sp.]
MLGFALAWSLLAGSVFFFAWAWIAVGAADAYHSGRVCAADAPANALCRIVGTDTVLRAYQVPGIRGGEEATTVVLRGHGNVPGGSVAGEMARFDGPPPTPGSAISVVAWRGTVVSADGAGFHGGSDANPIDEFNTTCVVALMLLFAGLGVLLVSRRSHPRNPRGWLGKARRNGLILLVPAAILLLVREPLSVVFFATVSALWILAWCAAATRPLLRQIGAEARSKPQPATVREAVSETVSGVRAAWQAAAPRADGCPVTAEEQAWIEESMLWFTTQFGYDPVQRPTILPTRDFFPLAYAGSDEDIKALVRTICPMMGLPADRITVRLVGEPAPDQEMYKYVAHSESYAAGVFEQDEGGARIVTLDRTSSADQGRMTAVIAHELGHARLNGESRIEPGRADMEALTDLSTVFFGLGIFNANAARTTTTNAYGQSVQRLGYLDQRMFGYALACYTRMRHHPEPKWASYLAAPPREYLNKGSAYLQKVAPHGGFPTQKQNT